MLSETSELRDLDKNILCIKRRCMILQPIINRHSSRKRGEKGKNYEWRIEKYPKYGGKCQETEAI